MTSDPLRPRWSNPGEDADFAGAMLAAMRNSARHAAAPGAEDVRESFAEVYTEGEYLLLREAARVGLTKKEITNKRGKKQTVWVRTGTATGADQHHTGGVYGPEHVAARAVRDPAALTHEDVKAFAAHLSTLPKEQCRRIALALRQKVGGTKAAIADRLLAHVRAQRGTAAEPHAVPTASAPTEPKPIRPLTDAPTVPNAKLVDHASRPVANLSDSRLARIAGICGRSVDVATMFAAGNAIDDARCYISADNHQITIRSGGGAGYTATRTISRDARGVLHCHNDYFVVDKEGVGPDAKPVNPNMPRGADMLANQIRGLRAMGVQYIDTYAAGNKYTAEQGDFVGYKVWPKLGYDGDIPDHLLAALPPQLKSQMGESKSILDLYKTKEGQNWWAENGSGLNLKFDLSDNSRSMQTLTAYLANRKGST